MFLGESIFIILIKLLYTPLFYNKMDGIKTGMPWKNIKSINLFGDEKKVEPRVLLAKKLHLNGIGVTR